MVSEKLFSRDYVLGFFAQFAYSSVFCLLIPTIPIYLLRLGSSEVEIGVLIGALSASALIFRPLVGKALLRIPEKQFMIAGCGLYVLSSVAYLFAPPFWPMLVVRVFHGIGSAFFSTAAFTLVANITPESHRGQLLSYYFVAINIAFTLAPYFGMLIINHLNFTALFLVCTALSLCALIITLKLSKSEITPIEGASGKNQPLFSREALPPSIMAFLVNIIWGAACAFFPLYALTHGVTNPGLFFGVLALIHVLVRSLGGRIFDLYRREKVIFPSLFGYIFAMAILAFSETLPMFIVAAVIWGLGNAFLYPTLVAYALDEAGTARATAMGTFTAIADLGAGLGPVIMGIILQWTGYRTMFLTLVLTGICNLLYFCSLVEWKKGTGLLPFLARPSRKQT